jgi:hypothetical protein
VWEANGSNLQRCGTSKGLLDKARLAQPELRWLLVSAGEVKSFIDDHKKARKATKRSTDAAKALDEAKAEGSAVVAAAAAAWKPAGSDSGAARASSMGAGGDGDSMPNALDGACNRDADDMARMKRNTAFTQDKNRLLDAVFRFWEKHPLANAYVFVGSSSGEHGWAEGRGPAMNNNQVLQQATAGVSAAIKKGELQLGRNELAHDASDNRSIRRGKWKKDTGFNLFRTECWPALAQQVNTEAGKPQPGQVIQKAVSQAWHALPKEERERYMCNASELTARGPRAASAAALEIGGGKRKKAGSSGHAAGNIASTLGNPPNSSIRHGVNPASAAASAEDCNLGSILMQSKAQAEPGKLHYDLLANHRSNRQSPCGSVS